MKKIYLLVFCIILLVIPLVVAPPPLSTIFSGDTGLNIEVNIMPVYKHGEARYSIIHVFNQTNGFMFNNTTSNIECRVYLRDSQGFEIMEVEAVVHGEHWDLNGTGGGANPVGMYAWTVRCIDRVQELGGYTSGYFEITKSGLIEDKTDTSSGISTTLFLLFITTMLFMFPLLKDFSKHKWANNIIKRAFCTVGIFVLMWNASILATIAENANLEIVSHLFRYMIIFGWAGYVSAAYLVLKSILEMLATWKIHKEKKRFGDKKDVF